MENSFNFKDFENVYLKACSQTRLGDRVYEVGETITCFQKISIAGLVDIATHVAASGGYGNRKRVFWDEVKEQQLAFKQGVMTKEQFALLSTINLLQSDSEPVSITATEYLESNEHNQLTLAREPNDKLFVYNKDTGAKINYTNIGKVVTIEDPYVNVVVNYEYLYNSNKIIYHLGQISNIGYVSLEGTTRVKDDSTGHVVTGLIKIPHLKIVSELNMSLGDQAVPMNINFQGIAVPVGQRNSSYVTEFILLDEDIHSEL